MAAIKAFDEEQTPSDSGTLPDAKIKTSTTAVDGEDAPRVVGPFLVGVELTRKEKLAAW